MTTATVTPEEFEKAVARACMRKANAWMIVDPFRHGDKTAVLTGPHLRDIAREAGISIPQTRRRMQKLLEAGKALRHDTSGGSTCWWLVGLAPPPAPAAAAPTLLPPFAPKVHATPSPDTARQGVTKPAVPLVREPWWKVLGVGRDCSTSEVRQAFKDCMDGVPEYDIDAEQQRQRIRDAYSQRLSEDGISEYE